MEGIELAKKIKAIYQRISAKNESGIDILFDKLGKQFFLNPESSVIMNLTKD